MLARVERAVSYRPKPKPGWALCKRCQISGGEDFALPAGEVGSHLRAHPSRGWVDIEINQVILTGKEAGVPDGLA